MCNLTRKIIAAPVVLFLIVVLSAPILTIHHVHRIETSEHADHHESSTGQAVTEVPTTYHETHILTLRSGDDFNSSTGNEVGPPLHKFIGTFSVVPVPSTIFSISSVTPANFRHHFQSARDKCVLICSFLI